MQILFAFIMAVFIAKGQTVFYILHVKLRTFFFINIITDDMKIRPSATFKYCICPVPKLDEWSCEFETLDFSINIT